MQDEQGKTSSYTVSAAMALAKGQLESLVLTIVGEVSQVSIKPGYKAAYFTVKDAGAALPCMMWNNRYAASGINLTVGQLVEITGRFTLYAAKGRMNFDVFSISLSGEGKLRLQVAELAKKLAAEGLTDTSKKRSLPIYPERIGLVTSPQGAAVHDVLRTLRRRFPIASVKLAGVPVEGKQAAVGLIAALECVVASGCDVVLLVRGGGSFEDMMPFNDEALARAIASCPVPVVTGIGHEVDTSIADMVSDLRASTPTAAAEAVSPSLDALSARLSSAASGLFQAISSQLERSTNVLDRIADKPMFSDPLLLFASEQMHVDNLSERIYRALPQALDRDRMRIAFYSQRVQALSPFLTDALKAQYAQAKRRMMQALPLVVRSQRQSILSKQQQFKIIGQQLLEQHRSNVRMQAAQLDTLSPLSIVARGYAVANDAAGKVISSVTQVSAGDDLFVRVSDGIIDCTVKEQ